LEFRALYTSAIRVINQKYNFCDNLSFNNGTIETSSLLNSMKIDNQIKKKIEHLIKENISTVKPRLFFLLNTMSLARFLSKRINTSMVLYYDNKLLFNEEEHKDLVQMTTELVRDYGVDNVNILSETKLMKEITDKKYTENDNFLIDFSKKRIISLIEKLPNTKIFYKPPGKKVFDPQEEFEEKEMYSQIMMKKVPYYTTYDEFLNLFYSAEEYKDYKEFETSEIVHKFFPSYLHKEFAFLKYWSKSKIFKVPILLRGKVVTGFQRGSRQLGVPTANLEMTKENGVKIIDMLSGVYIGKGTFLSNDQSNANIDTNKTYKCVLSIGWNPYFDNSLKTIEVFVIDYEGENFYNEELEISITSFIRTEANFENFGELVTAITYDIIQAN